MKFKTQTTTICLFVLAASIQFISCKKDNSELQTVRSSAQNNSVADSISDTSLVAWYTFNQGDLSDQSGHGNNIVFCNAHLTTGKKGIPRTAYLFNGTGSYMQVPNSNSLNPSSQITLAVLFKPKGYYAGITTRILMKGKDDQSSGDYFLGYNTDGTIYGTYGDNQFQSAGVSSPQNTLQLNKWQKLVYTYDGVTAKLYVNNQLVNQVTEAATFTPNTFPLRIGKTGRTDFPYYFNGAIDEIRIYNVALTQSQVKTIDTQMGQ